LIVLLLYSPGPLHEQLTEMAENHDMSFVRNIERQITGMANTMRTEFIVILQKN
jgi:hypothetical protein